MNLLTLLEVPWRSSHRSTRWFAIVIFVLCCCGAAAIGTFAEETDRWEGAIAIYGFGLVFLWAFFFSTSLLLAIDTRQLRVPHIQRHIVFGLVLYGLIGIALPAGVMAVLDLRVWNTMVTLALFSVFGLAFALMPRYIAVLMGLMPSVLTTLWRRFDWPGIADPRFAHWALIVVLVVLALMILRWRQLLLAGSSLSPGWSSPMAIQFRNTSWGQWGNVGNNRMLRQRPDWLRPVVDLDGVGPAQPRKALRIALGGWYLPQTTLSYTKQLTLMVCIFAGPAFVAILFTRFGQASSHAGDFLKGTIIGGLGSLSVITGPMICILSIAWLSKRWQRASSELSLLGLLPGLGDPAHTKRLLMRVGLGLPLAMHALLALPVVVAMLFWPGHIELLAFLLLAQLGTATITVAAALNLFGGRALTTLTAGLTSGASFVLTILGLALSAMATGSHPVPWAAWLLPPLALAWLLLSATMYWLGRRGWRDLMRRPHPFLLN